LLRKPRLADVDDIYREYATDPEVTRYLTWRPHSSTGETRMFLAACRREWQEGTAVNWTLRLRGDTRVVGMLGCRLDGHKAELGYVLARRLWGRGLMPEAVGAVVAWLWTLPEIRRIGAVCDVENLASARVMEKAGMQREGVLRRWLMRSSLPGEPRDCFVYSLVR